MPQTSLYDNTNSSEIQEIITAVPSWILRRGIMLVFLILIGIVLLSAFISYPDKVRLPLKVSSLYAPKQALCHQSGRLISILVKEGDWVKANQPLAFIESTGKHGDILALRIRLLNIRNQLERRQELTSSQLLWRESGLGELQTNFQIYQEACLGFLSTMNGGVYQKQRTYLQRDLQDIDHLEEQIQRQRQIQQQEYANAEAEFSAYEKLRKQNIISNSEYRQQQNKYLSGKYPLQQSESELLNNRSAYMAKQKELVTLENTINDQRLKFTQSLNAMLSSVDSWIRQYVVTAPMDGKVEYGGILQENQNVQNEQALFVVDPGNTSFFGEVRIPQYNMGKIAVGQKTLIKLRSYPYEEFGMVRGRVAYLTRAALQDSVFFGKIDFVKMESRDKSQKIELKAGMMADAEIITRESSLLHRFAWNVLKIFDKN